MLAYSEHAAQRPQHDPNEQIGCDQQDHHVVVVEKRQERQILVDVGINVFISPPDKRTSHQRPQRAEDDPLDEERHTDEAVLRADELHDLDLVAAAVDRQLDRRVDQKQGGDDHQYNDEHTQRRSRFAEADDIVDDILAVADAVDDLFTSEAISDRLDVFRFVNGDLKGIRQRIIPFEGFADILPGVDLEKIHLSADNDRKKRAVAILKGDDCQQVRLVIYISDDVMTCRRNVEEVAKAIKMSPAKCNVELQAQVQSELVEKIANILSQLALR